MIHEAPVLLVLHPERCRSTPALDSFLDLVAKLGELGFRIATFLEVKVHPVVNCLDDHLLPPATGEEDERDILVPGPNLFEKFEPVDIRHLVI